MKTFNLLWNMAYRILVVGLFLYFCYMALLPEPTNEQIADMIFYGVCLMIIRVNDTVNDDLD